MPGGAITNVLVPQVAYEVANFLDKNKDTLPEDLVRLLNNSSVDLIKTIFSVVSLDGKKSATVGTIFKVRTLRHL
jgi:myosin heavy subunit